MNRLIIFSLFIFLIASCKKEKEKVDYDSLISYQTLTYKTYNANCNCDTGYVTYAFYVANAFTPNGDNINEYWEPKSCGLDSSEYHITIFNKAGNVVFESSTPKKFDGRGKDEIMSTQTFGFYIEAKDKNGEYYTYRGKFVLYI